MPRPVTLSPVSRPDFLFSCSTPLRATFDRHTHHTSNNGKSIYLVIVDDDGILHTHLFSPGIVPCIIHCIDFLERSRYRPPTFVSLRTNDNVPLSARVRRSRTPHAHFSKRRIFDIFFLEKYTADCKYVFFRKIVFFFCNNYKLLVTIVRHMICST